MKVRTRGACHSVFFTEFFSMVKNYRFLKQWFYHNYCLLWALQMLSSLMISNDIRKRCFAPEKTYLRSNPNQKRLNHLMVLHIHKSLGNDMDLVDIAKNIVSRIKKGVLWPICATVRLDIVYIARIIFVQTFQLSRFCRDSPGFWYAVPVSQIESICPGFQISHQKTYHIHTTFYQQCKNLHK